MSININLVDKRNPTDAKNHRIKKLKAISIGILLFIAFLSIIIFAIDYRFSAGYVRKQQGEMMKALEPFSEPASRMFILNSKLSGISSLLSQRKKYNTVSSEILEGKPESLLIDEFSVDENGILVKASSNSLSTIDIFLNYCLSLIKAKTISSVVLENLSLVQGAYLIEVRLL